MTSESVYGVAMRLAKLTEIHYLAPDDSERIGGPLYVNPELVVALRARAPRPGTFAAASAPVPVTDATQLHCIGLEQPLLAVGTPGEVALLLAAGVDYSDHKGDGPRIVDDHVFELATLSRVHQRYDGCAYCNTDRELHVHPG